MNPLLPSELASWNQRKKEGLLVANALFFFSDVIPRGTRIDVQGFSPADGNHHAHFVLSLFFLLWRILCSNGEIHLGMLSVLSCIIDKKLGNIFKDPRTVTKWGWKPSSEGVKPQNISKIPRHLLFLLWACSECAHAPDHDPVQSAKPLPPPYSVATR